MAHSHSHVSSHLPGGNNARRLLYVSGVTAGSMLVEVVGGFLSGSLALLADAGHILTSTAALLSALLTMQSPHCLPVTHYTLGRLRLTTFTASVNAIALVVIIILIVWEVIEHFHTPRSVEGDMMMAIAVARLLVNIPSLWLPHHGSEGKDLNARAAALHMFGDLLGSVGAIITALIITWAGWIPTDPIFSILVSLLVPRSAWRLLKNSVNELFEGASVSLDTVELKYRTCRKTPKIRNVHHVRVWMIGEKPAMTLHAQMIPPHDRDALLDQTQHYLMNHYQIEYAIIQMECQPRHGSDCHLNERMFGHSHRHH